MTKKELPQKVMVFGVFDQLHPGHFSLLVQARRYGEKLIVVVARDATANQLKKRKPQWSEQKRLRVLHELPIVYRVMLGDRIQGSYAVITKYKPDVICLGYDQHLLERDLRRNMKARKIPFVRIVQLKPYHPEKFHSSKMGHYGK